MTYTANEEHRYGVRYEFISDLISEKVSHFTFPPNSDMRSDINPIGPHIGMVFHHNHCPYRRDIGNSTSRLVRRSEKQRKKRVGPNDFYMKRLSDMRSDMNSYRSDIGKPFPAHFRYETDMRSIGPHIGNIILYSLLYIYI